MESVPENEKIQNISIGSDFVKIREFLLQQLKERKDLANQLTAKQNELVMAQKEYDKHQKMFDEFPSMLENLQNAMDPISNYLG